MGWSVGWNVRRQRPDESPKTFAWHQEAVKFLEDELWFLGTGNSDEFSDLSEAIAKLDDLEVGSEFLTSIGRYEYWIKRLPGVSP